MSSQGSRRPGRREGKHWLEWRGKGQESKAASRALETAERQQAEREIREHRMLPPEQPFHPDPATERQIIRHALGYHVGEPGL